MPDTNNIIYAQQYSENIMQLAQQKMAKLWYPSYQKTNVRGKNVFQDQIGEWTMSKKTGRHPATPSSDPRLARRMVVMDAFHDAVLLDRSDELKVISDPRSAYTIAAGKSLGRQIDDVAIEALGSDAFTGETGSVVTALPASQIIVNGATGLSFDKVNAAQRILNDNDVEEDERFFVTSPQGIEDLMAEEKATSSDFNTMKAIQSGQFAGNTWMGFQWIMSTRLDVAANIRECFAFHKYGLCVALSELPFVRTDEREDLSYSWQVYYELNIGATRLEEDRVVRVDIDES